MISEETIQQVRAHSNIVKVVGERVKLQRAGRSYKGLCPFHQEKTPSFHVNEERNFYHCFGCHAHGDSIRFVQETEGLSFVEAVTDLARRFGVELVETRSDGERRQQQAVRREQDELYAVSETAAQYFERCLTEHPLADLARGELARRGLELGADPTVDATLQAFRIGYAPYGWDGLAHALRRSGLSPVAGEKVGLLAPRRSGPGHYDRFRHRLMFAVLDLRGRVIAFSGRSLPEPDAELLQRHGIPAMGSGGDEPAKYINSPESPVYKKREAVFGLYQARDQVRRLDRCVLVEGNFDVVSLHARGICNVVAPLGTAFTREQAALIKRYSQNVTLLFDADSAGRRATTTARDPCQQEGLLARVATLPEGTDPDDLVRQRGPDALDAIVKSAKGMLDHLIESALDGGFSAADPETQGRKIQEVLELVRSEEDPTVRALAHAHADTIAARLGIADVRSMSALQRAVRQAAAPRPGDAPARNARGRAPETARSEARYDAIEATVLGALTEYPELLRQPDVQGLLPHASGALALALAQLSRAQSLADELDRFPVEARAVVARHLAAPEYDELSLAHKVLSENLHKLEIREHKRLKADLEAELRQVRSLGDHQREDEILLELMTMSRTRAARKA